MPAAPVSTVWYVAHTKPRQESTAREQLLRQDFEVYLPLFKVFKKPRAGAQRAPAAPGLTAREPMFPRYLFLRPTRPTQSLSVIRSTVGISRLVMFGPQPATLADAAVRVIHQAETLRESAQMDQISPFQPGMPVQIQDSPLAGMQALVQAVSKDRVTLLLNILGRPQTVQVEFGQIAPL
ncbi:transcription termination/antitermination protein NusG [Castellaniella sp.]|uniref:transcription termination/antitermination protein NusG n=1 Tax=Castellaniella sp. TaxID=1955812 RepID=UPI002AFFFD73|nr:transcription termination/antitermination NusG family protein [Castellaniella sp.]